MRSEACSCIELGAVPQRWQVETVSGRPLAAGERIVLRAVHRTACASYAATAGRGECASDRVQLSTEGAAGSVWVLVDGA